MTRFLSLLAGGLLGLVAVWGCSSLPPPSDGDDDDNSSKSGSNGQGGANSNAGKAGNGSGGAGTSCLSPQQMCNGVCTSVASDPLNCGMCGNSCNGQFCSNSMCKAACDMGLEPCGTSCVSTHGSDVNNCGTCGMRCAVNQACNLGVCTTTQGVGGAGGTPGTGGVGGQPPVGGMAGQGAVSATGGMGATAGSGMSGAAGSGAATNNPPGYWTYGAMHGCAWTGIDTVSGTTTTVTPKDFTMGHTPDQPYCVKGSVNADYESVALLGFNLAQPAEGANCTYDPAAATALGPPELQLTGTGLAISFSKTTASTLRVQLQSQDGATNSAHRWCTTITDAAGPVFIPYSAFTTECWEGGTPVKYNNEPISAVVFLVPGTPAATPYDFCINGFADGMSVADAPTGGMTGGSLSGTIGGSGSTDLDFQRVKVKVGGKSYIIQNNNWGNPGGSNQTISYKDNSFKITQMDGSGSSAPASFPSIYIGANGDTQGGTFSTSSDDHLPKQISAITSLSTTFKFTTTGNMNAAYDIWFSDRVPTACYGDAISGFIMLWFHQPSGFHPIGDAAIASNVPIGGSNWNVWKGNRGTTGASMGTCAVQNSGALVISYVATSDMPNVTNLDLKPFFTDAVSNRGFNGSFYLTDLFAGFEIWSGGTGAEVKEFTANVLP